MFQRLDLGDRIAVEPCGRDRGRAASRRTRSSPRRSPRSSAARLARRRSRSGSRSPRASAAAAPTRRPRSGSPTQQLDQPLDRSAAARARSGARRRRAVLPARAGRNSARGDGTTLEPVDAAAGLRRLPPAAARGREAVDRGGLRGVRRADGAAGFAERAAALRAGARRRPSGGRPRRRCRRTTSRRRRSRPRCWSRVRSAPTSAAPGRAVYGLFADRGTAACRADAVLAGRVSRGKPCVVA